MESAKILTFDERCSRLVHWELSWERAKIDSKELLSSGIRTGLTTKRSDYGDAAGEKIKETTWHRLVLFGGLSDIAQTYLRKGDCAYFEGRIQNRTYEDKTGQTRNVTEVVVNELKLLPTQGESTSTSAPSTPAPSAKRTAAKARTVEVDDSDSPF